MDIPKQEQERVNRIFAQLAKLPPVVLHIDAVSTYILICYVQLACRHPYASGETRDRMERLGKAIQSTLALKVPEANEALEAGWDKNCDVEAVDSTKNSIPYYSHLPQDYQKEVVANSIALEIACRTIGRLTGMSSEQATDVVCDEVDNVISQMNERDISHIIMTMDLVHQGANEEEQTNDQN